MISLYESILGDIDTNIEASDNAVSMLSINKEGSEARKIFGIDEFYPDSENPFDVKGKVLEVFPLNSKTNKFLPNCYSTYNARHTSKLTWNTDLINEPISNIIGSKINKILAAGSVVISGSNLSKFSNLYAPELQATTIEFHGYDSTVLQNMNLITKVHPSLRLCPYIRFVSEKPMTLKNVNLTLDSEQAYSPVSFTRLPIFNNVKGNIESFYVEVPREFRNRIKSDDILKDDRFNDLFEFGYKLTYVDKSTGKESRINTVKNATSFKAMMTANNFHNREYNENPYRLKPGVKLTDIIDISGWTNLKKITISLVNFYIMFYREDYFQKQFNQTQDIIFSAVLKKHPLNSTRTKQGLDELKNNIPATTDGWRVVITL